MAWLYVPGLADSNSESGLHSETAIAASVTSNAKRMLPRHWSRAWKKAAWTRLLSGMTLAPSTAIRGVAEFISSLPESPTKTTLSPESGNSNQPGATSGPTLGESLGKWDPITSSWRTCGESLFPEMDNRPLSLGSSASWPVWGMCLRGSLYQLPQPEPAKGGSGYSCWPAATAHDVRQRGRGQTLEKNGAGNGCLARDASLWTISSRQDQDSDLTELLNECLKLSKPALTERAVGFLRTLLSGRRGSESSPPIRASRRRLSPAFAEWLMGWPPGHTACEPAATEPSLWLRRMRSELLLR